MIDPEHAGRGVDATRADRRRPATEAASERSPGSAIDVPALDTSSPTVDARGPAAPLLALQRLAGNQAVSAALARARVGEGAGAAAGPVQRSPKGEGYTAEDLGTDVASTRQAVGPAATPPAKITGYVGMNPRSDKEVGALRGSSKEKVVVSTGSAKLEARLKDDAAVSDYVTQDLGIDPGDARHAKAVNALVSADPVARDTLAEMMQWMNKAEKGEIALDRLVLSGHSNGFQFWGDSARRGAPQKPGMVFLERDMGNITAAFPGASSQVRSIMFSACETVGSVQTVIRLFPNLDSVWAYAGFSPDIKKGSAAHIQAWARSTEGAKTPTKAQAKGASAIWTKSAGFIVNDPGANSVEQVYTEAMAAFTGVATPVLAGQKEPSNSELNPAYNRINALRDHPGVSKDRKEMAIVFSEMVYRLRHWEHVRTAFATNFGPELVPAYKAIDQPMPKWASITRKALAAHVKSLEAVFAAHPDATDAKAAIERLVDRGLLQLRDNEVAPIGPE